MEKVVILYIKKYHTLSGAQRRRKVRDLILCESVHHGGIAPKHAEIKFYGDSGTGRLILIYDTPKGA